MSRIPSTTETLAVLLIALLLAGSHRSAAADDDFAARFAQPRPTARMLKIVHGWSPDAAERTAALARLESQGYGGVVTNLNFAGGYMASDANWAILRDILSRLKAAGMPAWLYDEAGYPSGRAGTMVLDGRPELEAKGLMILRRTVGPGAVEIETPPGEVLLAAAYPVDPATERINLDECIALSPRETRLSWTVPAGRWSVIVITVDRLYDGTQVAVSGTPQQTPYVGLLEPETTRRFMALTHDCYAERLGSGLDRFFAATFTDEPSTMAMFFIKMPWATLPWCADFAEEFQRRNGYDLLPELPRLVAASGDRDGRVRSDYYRTVSEHMVERWWEPIRRWCRDQGVASGGHLLLEENILHHVPLYGDAFTALRHMDSTGIDCLSSDPAVPRYRSHAGMGADVPWNAARLASSAAELDGRPMVMCEVSEHMQRMARPPIAVSAEQYRGTWNRLVLGGINVLTSYHRFDDWSDAEIREANQYVGRCVEATSGGRRAGRVAVLYPIESVWARFTPSNHWVEQASPECKRIEETLRDLSEALYAARREFSYIDTRTILEAEAADGRLSCREHAWNVVVLPEADTLPLAAWRKLEAFSASGGTLILLGARPRNTEQEFPSSDVASLAERLLSGEHPALLLTTGQTAEAVQQIADVLPADLEVAPADAPLRMTRRIIADGEVWFVINDSRAAWSGSVTLPVSGPVQIGDPMTGAIREEPGPTMTLDLPAYGAAVLRAREAAR